MSKPTAINVTISRPRATRVFLTPINQAGFILSSFSSAVQTANIQVESFRSVEQQFISRVYVNNVIVESSPGDVEIPFVSAVQTANVQIGSARLNVQSDFISAVETVNPSIVKTDIVIDNEPPTNPTWGLSEENIIFNGFDVVLDFQATDNQEPQSNLTYGLAVGFAGLSAVQDKFDAAVQAGFDAYGGFDDVKTGAELSANGNKLFFRGGTRLDENDAVNQYDASVIVWDSYGNSSQYNFLQNIELPALNITTFEIDQESLVLDINSEGTLTVTYEGTGISGDVIWSSEDPLIAEHLGNGVFRGFEPGETGAKAISADDGTVQDIVPLIVQSFVTSNEGDDNDFTVGASQIIEQSFSSAVESSNVVVTADTASLFTQSFSSAVETSSAAVSTFLIDLSEDNAVAFSYTPPADGQCNAEAVEYFAPNRVLSGFSSAVETSNVATVESVIPLIVEESFTSGGLETNNPVVISNNELIDPFIEQSFTSNVETTNVATQQTLFFLQPIVSESFSSAVETGNVTTQQVIYPLVVNSAFSSAVETINVQVQSSNSLIIQFIEQSFISGAVDTISVQAPVSATFSKYVNSSFSSAVETINVATAQTVQAI